MAFFYSNWRRITPTTYDILRYPGSRPRIGSGVPVVDSIDEDRTLHAAGLMKHYESLDKSSDAAMDILGLIGQMIFHESLDIEDTVGRRLVLAASRTADGSGQLHNHSYFRDLGNFDRYLYESFKPSPFYLMILLVWFKDRETTMEEDKVYALVSLLGICLPPQYGEGLVSAFQRVLDATNIAGELQMSLPKSIQSIPSHCHVTITHISRDRSKMCGKHQSRGGTPILVDLAGHDFDPEKCHYQLHATGPRPNRYLLYIGAPLPGDDVKLRDQFRIFNPGKTPMERSSQLPLLLYTGDMEVVASLFEWCHECCCQKFCSEDSMKEELEELGGA
ncbi:hypothetical protein ONZ45_g8142 [Pleurotus djamor]|nr:hypothetical protein ONZ45_g8142 [Pleurotus djamor]